MAAKYYLENSINGKQIKDCYDITNKVTFIDLQNDVFKNLIDITYNIDKDDLIKNVLNYSNILNVIIIIIILNMKKKNILKN